MAFDINNFVIDRPIRGIMFDTATDDVMFAINQITNPSLSITSDSVTAVDAIGAAIAEFDRAKNAEFSAENSLFDLGLAAAQFASEKKVASVTSTIVAPKWETLTYKTGDTTVELKQTPIGAVGAEIKQIYTLNGDGTMGNKYILSAVAESATEFMLDGKELTYPTGLANGTQLFVAYNYNADAAIEVVNQAVNFPKPGRFVLQVLAQDICSPSIKYFAYVEFPNAKLRSAVDLSFTSEATHSFTIACMQGYCDAEKKLFRIVVPEQD